MAKHTETVDEVETDEVDETEEVEETEGMRPKDLALELGIDPKTLRGWLRKEYARPADKKNTSWLIAEDVADAAREHFLADDEEDDTETDEVEA
jgi:uncharacterized protein YjcR